MVLFLVKRQGNETFRKKNVGYWEMKRYIGFRLFLSLSSHSGIFHSYEYVTIAGEGLHIKTYAHGHLSVRVFFSAPHLL